MQVKQKCTRRKTKTISCYGGKEMKKELSVSSCRSNDNGSGYGIYCDCICRRKTLWSFITDTWLMWINHLNVDHDSSSLQSCVDGF